MSYQLINPKYYKLISNVNEDVVIANLMGNIPILRPSVTFFLALAIHIAE